MDAFIVNVLPDLGQTGQARALSGAVESEGYAVGSQRYATPQGVSYDVQLANTGEAVLLSGTVRAHVEGACARCLEPAAFELEGEVQGYYLLAEDTTEPVEGLERDEYDYVGADGTVDIADALDAALVHATPFVVLCRRDCAGLCPTCGENLNDGPCGCTDGDIDPTNPFSVLKDFDFGGE